MKKIFIAFFACIAAVHCFAQKIDIVSAGTKTSLRGLSVVNDKILWVSGSGGMVGRSVNGGKTFTWMKVTGSDGMHYSKTEFRDIEAFDSLRAIIMGVDTPALILKTVDGGNNWRVVYENKTPGMFLDAMEFFNEKNGIVVGDPINNKFFIARTDDGGNSWQEIPKENYPQADSGEAFFASSGTNIRKLHKNEAVMVSGGLTSHLIRKDHKMMLPLLQGTTSTGANSIAVKNFKTMMVVGGDFNKKDSIYKNCFYTTTAGRLWLAPEVPPHGYRSCVEYLGGRKWIT
ncbi:MAG: oxidoreductase, partial [Ferruginibacter sp.]